MDPRFGRAAFFIFVDIDSLMKSQDNEQKQSLRILKRNGPIMHKRFLSEWIPLENRYFKEMKIQEQSDLVFSG